MNKQEKQLINEWLKLFVKKILIKPCGLPYSEYLEQFQKQHNLIDDELEVGKWYKYKKIENTLYFTTKEVVGGFNAYGINIKGKWIRTIWFEKDADYLEPAPKSYVIERLTWYAEEVMKYNHEKPNYKCLYEPKDTTSGNVKSYELNYNGDLRIVIGNHANIVMKKGVWAETFEVEEEETKEVITIKIPKGVDYKIEVI